MRYLFVQYQAKFRKIAIISNLADNPGPRYTEFVTKLDIGENTVF